MYRTGEGLGYTEGRNLDVELGKECGCGVREGTWMWSKGRMWI